MAGITLRQRGDLFEAQGLSIYEIANPDHLLAGHFDYAFVCVFLLPLLIIGWTYAVLSGEKESGWWALLLAQSCQARALLLRRLVCRWAVFCLLACGAVPAHRSFRRFLCRPIALSGLRFRFGSTPAAAVQPLTPWSSPTPKEFWISRTFFRFSVIIASSFLSPPTTQTDFSANGRNAEPLADFSGEIVRNFGVARYGLDHTVDGIDLCVLEKKIPII